MAFHSPVLTVFDLALPAIVCWLTIPWLYYKQDPDSDLSYNRVMPQPYYKVSFDLKGKLECTIIFHNLVLLCYGVITLGTLRSWKENQEIRIP